MRRKETPKDSRMERRQEMRKEVGGGDGEERSAPRTAPCPHPCTNVLMGWNQRLTGDGKRTAVAAQASQSKVMTGSSQLQLNVH